ncbi:hypothetical protein AWR36_013635 [Microbulbifer flavimaris]|uniref:Uncharacterized protein n=1 Tax=Microbulbifer flavimaris TaxID=1781068 RepID=A0ABX4HWP1_9GAMM|nr:hypothetical protein AWR36_013635 [Microbulbifer flavimaris]
MEDKLSSFFLGASSSSVWLSFGVLALAALISLSLASIEKGSVLEMLLIGVGVTGVLFTWLSAQAHAHQRSSKFLVIAIFLVWPLSYWYLFREKWRAIT